MPYQRINWVNFPDTSTPIDEINLGHMEDGIELAINGVEELNTKVPTIVPVLSQGTKIATIIVNGNSFDLLSPEGGGADVFYTQTITSGTALGTLTINGTDYVIYAPQSGTNVSFTPSFNAGIKIGEITIDDVTQEILSPDINYETTVEGITLGSLHVGDVDYLINIPESNYIPTITEGIELGTVKLNGIEYKVYAPQYEGSNVTYIPLITEGEKIGELQIDGINNPIYMNNRYITMQEWESLPDSKFTDGIHYYIIDVEPEVVQSPFRFGIDSEGNYGYYKLGETILTPFGTGEEPVSKAPANNASRLLLSYNTGLGGTSNKEE